MCCVVDTISHFQILGEGEGNVHSGATPPWLREDDNEGGAPAQIGPSEEEFLRHSNGTPPSIYMYMYTTNIVTLGHYTNNGGLNSHPTCGWNDMCKLCSVNIHLSLSLPTSHISISPLVVLIPLWNLMLVCSPFHFPHCRRVQQ